MLLAGNQENWRLGLHRVSDFWGAKRPRASGDRPLAARRAPRRLPGPLAGRQPRLGLTGPKFLLLAQ